MGIPNQGYRRDLNLAETTSDRVALANLGGAGIAEDLDKLANNLRNTFLGFSCDLKYHPPQIILDIRKEEKKKIRGRTLQPGQVAFYYIHSEFLYYL